MACPSGHARDATHCGLPAGYDPAQLFTTDRSATPVHVVQWGFLGYAAAAAAWPGGRLPSSMSDCSYNPCCLATLLAVPPHARCQCVFHLSSPAPLLPGEPANAVSAHAPRLPSPAAARPGPSSVPTTNRWRNTGRSTALRRQAVQTSLLSNVHPCSPQRTLPLPLTRALWLLAGADSRFCPGWRRAGRSWGQHAGRSQAAHAQASVSAAPLQVVGFVPTGWLYEMKRETFSGEHRFMLLLAALPCASAIPPVAPWLWRLTCKCRRHAHPQLIVQPCELAGKNLWPPCRLADRPAPRSAFQRRLQRAPGAVQRAQLLCRAARVCELPEAPQGASPAYCTAYASYVLLVACGTERGFAPSSAVADSILFDLYCL